MVTWGQNDTRFFSSSNTPATGSTAAPAPLFGASTPTPAPAAGGAFSTPTLGSSPAPAPPPFSGLSAAAPAPATTGSLFGGGTPAPAPAGGLFGSTTPAPAPGLFGTTPAPVTGGFAAPAPAPLFGTTPAPATGAFGAPAPTAFGAPAPSAFGFGTSSTSSAFGAPAPSAFGAPPTQQQQIPAQAAMQAHMDASARQEEARLKAKMEQLHGAYASVGPRDSNETAPFVSILYDPISPEQLQRQWMHRVGTHGKTLIAPPKPDQVSEKDWISAVVRNPDPELYMPVAVVGAAALRQRVVNQQDKATSLGRTLEIIKGSHESLQTRAQRSRAYIQNMTRTHAALRQRLLDVMRKVEVVRCMNQPLQHEEVQATQRLSELLRQLDRVSGVLGEIQNQARSQQHISVAPDVTLPDKSRLLQDLKNQRDGIDAVTKVVQRDVRDTQLLQQRVVQKVPTPSVVSLGTRPAF